MDNKSNVLRKLTRRINQIEGSGALALEKYGIISMQSFYNMQRSDAQSLLLHVVTDLKNFRTEFKKSGLIKFYSNIYIKLFEQIGFHVKQNSATYNLANIAYIDKKEESLC